MFNEDDADTSEDDNSDHSSDFEIMTRSDITMGDETGEIALHSQTQK